MPRPIKSNPWRECHKCDIRLYWPGSMNLVDLMPGIHAGATGSEVYTVLFFSGRGVCGVGGLDPAINAGREVARPRVRCAVQAASPAGTVK